MDPTLTMLEVLNQPEFWAHMLGGAAIGTVAGIAVGGLILWVLFRRRW